MKILFAASEAKPFFVSDGPGVMTGDLPPALSRRRADIRVILPLYRALPAEWREKLRFVTRFNVPVAWRSQYCGLFELSYRDVTWYFLDNIYYFDRPGLYGFYDDGERFAYFARAVLEMLLHIDFAPEIIHCNDWQTALTPVYLNLYYRHLEKFSKIKTVFTIHDILHQCTYSPEVLEYTLGIGRENMNILEHRGAVNLTKGAIEACDFISTVSPSYANEIPEPEAGCGLEEFLRKKRSRLSGILNGINISEYNPMADPHIAANYGTDDAEPGKKICKQALCRAFGSDDAEPLIGVLSPFTDERGFGLVAGALNALATDGFRVIIAGNGEAARESVFAELAARSGGRIVRAAEPGDEARRRLYAGCDMLLIPNRREPCGFDQMVALRYGTVPVAHETGGLRDTIRDDVNGSGNGFLFGNYDVPALLAACRRARETYRDTRAWAALVRRAMQCDNSWATAAGKYMNMYRR